jgi:hypothetical protein
VVVSIVVAVRAAADTFLGHLRRGEVDAAYDGLCASARQSFSLARFAQTVAARPRLAGYSIANVTVSDFNGAQSATVQARLTYPDGSTDDHALRLVPEQGWKVCGSSY